MSKLTCKLKMLLIILLVILHAFLSREVQLKFGMFFEESNNYLSCYENNYEFVPFVNGELTHDMNNPNAWLMLVKPICSSYLSIDVSMNFVMVMCLLKRLL